MGREEVKPQWNHEFVIAFKYWGNYLRNDRGPQDYIKMESGRDWTWVQIAWCLLSEVLVKALRAIEFRDLKSGVTNDDVYERRARIQDRRLRGATAPTPGFWALLPPATVAEISTY